jgi:uncharacterized protein (TIGR03066 family)
MKIKLVLALFVGLAIGCSPGKDSPMVGRWKLDETTGAYKSLPEDHRQKVDVEFKRDETFTFKVKGGDKTEEIAGTYKLDGTKLTMTPTQENGKPTNEKPITVEISKDFKSFDMPLSAGKIVKQ